MSDALSIESLPNVPFIQQGDDIGEIIARVAQEQDFDLQDNDVLCIASKAVSSAEGRTVSLNDIEAGKLALSIHESIPRKDPRVIQAIIDETGAPDGSRLELKDNYIGGWLPNGLFLTSAGVDKLQGTDLILLPENADESARVIGNTLLKLTGNNVSVIITDSEGRPDKLGSSQIAIGLYGIPALRESEVELEDGKTKRNEETLCDMLAASAAILMGQRGTHKPVVRIRGVDYTFDSAASISDGLNSNVL